MCQTRIRSVSRRSWSGRALFLASMMAACGGSPGTTADRASPEVSPSVDLPPGVEAISFLGDTLRAAELAPSVLAERAADLARAEAQLGADPNDPDPLIWVGRRMAYLGRYRKAIEIFSEGIQEHPEDARFYRHRGHRYITVRQLDRAIADLSRAAQLVAGEPDQTEPDGQPNERGVPVSTLQTNIWYHLGLARYLKGELENAAQAYRKGLEVAANPDMQVAFSHWLYMTYQRLGMEREASEVLGPISAGLDIIENQAYHELLLLYQGARTPEDLAPPPGEATPASSATLYGLGNWHLYHGRAEEARAIFEAILNQADQWASFGFIAAEAEMAGQIPLPTATQEIDG